MDLTSVLLLIIRQRLSFIGIIYIVGSHLNEKKTQDVGGLCESQCKHMVCFYLKYMIALYFTNTSLFL